jgi:hypothetical protein
MLKCVALYAEINACRFGNRVALFFPLKGRPAAAGQAPKGTTTTARAMAGER